MISKSTKLALTAATCAMSVCVAAASPAAACFVHTFNACGSPAREAYELSVNRKTGATYLRILPKASPRIEKPETARIDNGVQRFATGRLLPLKRAGAWTTTIEVASIGE